MKSYFRPEIDQMSGYVPGEQPRMANLIKLNTNENPYAPSPRVAEVLAKAAFAGDVLARSVSAGTGEGFTKEQSINGEKVVLTVTKAQ